MVIIMDRPSERDRQALQSHVSSLNRSDIRCIAPDRDLSLGALRNVSMSNANGDILCQWDDDDLSHPNRLTAQVEFILTNVHDAAILTDNLHIFLDEGLCYWETGRRNLIGGRPSTLMVRRHHGLLYPESGPESIRGEDTYFLKELRTRLNLGYFEAPAFHYLYFFHGSNTMDSAHHRMLALRTSVPREQLLANCEHLTKGIREVAGFGLSTLRMNTKEGYGLTWSESNDSIVFDEAKLAYRSRKLLLLSGEDPGLSLVYSPIASEPLKLPSSIAQLVLRMTDFKSLDDHGWDLCAVLNSNQGSLKDFLTQLVTEGILISEEELKTQIISHDEELDEQQPWIQGFGVPTCD